MEQLKAFVRDFYENYKIELFFLTASLIIVTISISLFLVPIEKKTAYEPIRKNISDGHPKTVTGLIYVDISGSVLKPDVYQLTKGTRLKELIRLAGGISDQADKNFFNRNFNLARTLTDQEKYYVPSYSEIAASSVQEEQHIIDYTNSGTVLTSNKAENEKININSAQSEVLESLPGIGTVTADKIIQNRPYASIDELITKKILKQNIFDQTKNYFEI